jgi:hypothetical protein
MTMRGKPDVNRFLEGGAATENPPLKERGRPRSSDKVERRPKLVRLPSKMLLALKRRALDESERIGARVTETDIIERAISKYLTTKDI